MNRLRVTRGVIADFEAHKSLVHTIALVPFVVSSKKCILQKKDAVLIKVINIVNTINDLNPEIINKKNLSDLSESCYGGIHAVYPMSFHEAIPYMCEYINSYGGTLVSHNLLEDLAFLEKTQSHVDGKTLVNPLIKSFPETGIRNKYWKDIKKVCSISLVCNRCHYFKESYSKYVGKNPSHDLTPKRYCPVTLESLSRFVKEDPKYVQSHSALKDTFDLFEVIHKCYSLGDTLFDGCSFLTKPDWFSPVAPSKRKRDPMDEPLSKRTRFSHEDM